MDLSKIIHDLPSGTTTATIESSTAETETHEGNSPDDESFSFNTPLTLEALCKHALSRPQRLLEGKLTNACRIAERLYCQYGGVYGTDIILRIERHGSPCGNAIRSHLAKHLSSRHLGCIEQPQLEGALQSIPALTDEHKAMLEEALTQPIAVHETDADFPVRNPRSPLFHLIIQWYESRTETPGLLRPRGLVPTISELTTNVR
ncbi:hypothetical protein FRC18_005352 [Serendipita sp. 400]|nr:hypothetical protein FRC18_005352 [Serendipita sp. 400]